MTPSDFLALLPLLVLFGSVVAVLLSIAIVRSRPLAAGISLAGIAAAFAVLPAAASAGPRTVTALLKIDAFTLYFDGLLLAASFATAVFAYGYFRLRRTRSEEFYVLILAATLGGCLLPASVHFATLFLALELLTVSLFAMTAYLRTDPPGIEAGIKYLILAAVSTAFLLFGAALIYADRGTLVLGRILIPGSHDTLWTAAGLAMVLVGIGFKLGVVPFQLWVPDIYQGAPAPVTAFLATVSKGAMFAGLMRIFSLYSVQAAGGLYDGLSAVAVFSMLVGNWLALFQTNIKRMLAYSSIAHFGYFAAVLAAFGVVGILSDKTGEAQDLEAYRGLFWRRPLPAVVFTTALISMIGIPLTAGFIGKFYLLLAGIGSAVWLLAVVLVVASAIGLYYYLRVILTMARTPEKEPGAMHSTAPGTRPVNLILAALALGILWLRERNTAA
jgi:NADH-quinone oxidoreductase subunit N